MDTQETGLRFEESGLARTLAQRILHVPLNQRSYAWEKPEVETLLSDLFRAFIEGSSVYFLGTIVLTQGNRQSEVADGQQRLATTSIIIAAVRDYLFELGDDAGAQKYQSSYLLDYDVRRKDHKPKLFLNFQDHDYFLSQILTPPAERAPFTGQPFSSHALLAKAAELAAAHVRNITAAVPDAEKPERLYDWIDFLSDAAKVFLITVPGKVGNAFKMFETLNARGMEASKTDILKNYLFDLAKDRLGDIHPRWISMVTTIEGTGEDELLMRFVRHFWVSQHGPTTEREFGGAVEVAIRSERQAVDLISQLAGSATDYVALLSPRDHPRWTDMGRAGREALYTISRELGGEQIRPLMLAVARHFDPVEAEKAFVAMVSWSVRFLIVGGGGGGVLDTNYGRRARDVSKGEIKTAAELKQRMAEVIPGDTAFAGAFATASVRKTNLARYYLRALETHVKGERYPQLLPNDDTRAVNLEHILPVTPGPEWDVPQEVAAAYYRRIGNMVLLNAKQNVELGNKGFPDKRPTLKASPFVLTSDVAISRKWGAKQIENRQAVLAELAPFVWPL